MNSVSNATAHARHHFSYPAHTVFDAWLNPHLLGKWMFHPSIQQEEVVDIQIDGRNGGAFRFVVRRGETLHEYSGTYLDLRRPTQLIFTWSSSEDPRATVISVTISETHTGCEVNVVHELGEAADETIRRITTRWQEELTALSHTLG